jgi:uncharacterized Zn finger protein (UPF0148 family)
MSYSLHCDRCGRVLKGHVLAKEVVDGETVCPSCRESEESMLDVFSQFKQRAQKDFAAITEQARAELLKGVREIVKSTPAEDLKGEHHADSTN